MVIWKFENVWKIRNLMKFEIQFPEFGIGIAPNLKCEPSSSGYEYNSLSCLPSRFITKENLEEVFKGQLSEEKARCFELAAKSGADAHYCKAIVDEIRSSKLRNCMMNYAVVMLLEHMFNVC